MPKKITPHSDRPSSPITRKMKLKAFRSQCIPCLCDFIFLTSIASYYGAIHALNGPIDISLYAYLHIISLFLVFFCQYWLRFLSLKSTRKSIKLVMTCLVCLGAIRFIISILGFLCVFFTMTALKIDQSTKTFVAGGVLGIVHLFYVIATIFFVMKTLEILKDNLRALKSEIYAVSTIQPGTTLGRVV